MAVPKRKTSKARRDKRRASTFKLTAPTLIKCSKCDAMILTHRLCDTCGAYGGKEIVRLGKEEATEVAKAPKKAAAKVKTTEDAAAKPAAKKPAAKKPAAAKAEDAEKKPAAKKPVAKKPAAKETPGDTESSATEAKPKTTKTKAPKAAEASAKPATKTTRTPKKTEPENTDN